MKVGDKVTYEDTDCIIAAIVDKEQYIVELPTHYRGGWDKETDTILKDYEPSLANKYHYADEDELRFIGSGIIDNYSII